MKRVAILIALLAIAAAAFAQGATGVIIGKVMDGADAVGGATVQATDSSGRIFKAVTPASGQFRITGVPAGTYELSVPQLGLRTARYVQPGVVVESGKTVTATIALMPNNQGIIGDDEAYLQVHNKNLNLKGPAPRAADGHADFSGVWLANIDQNPEPASLLPWAVEELNKRRAANFAGMPTARCLPTDPTLSVPFFYKILQTRALLVYLFEPEPHYRQVFLDGRAHPKDPDPTWMGHSIGKWEKDTLVIDTMALNDKSWLLQGVWLPHTEMLHIVQRLRRPDLAHLENDVTLEDPGTFVAPVHRHIVWELAPGEEILESVCENNKFEQNAGLK